jgi:hypothetical protein
VDRAGGGSLVALLAVEEEALASLGSPGSNMVGDIGNLVGFERGDRLKVDGLRAEPEQLLGVQEVPDCALAHGINQSDAMRQHTWGSWRPGPCARGGPPRRA